MKYIFRGIVVFEYNPKNKAMKMPQDQCKHGNFNFCHFIPEDYLLMSDFFKKAHQHALGENVELKDVEVY